LGSLHQLAGSAAIAGSAWLVSPVLGLFVAGLLLVCIGQAVDHGMRLVVLPELDLVSPDLAVRGTSACARG